MEPLDRRRRTDVLRLAALAGCTLGFVLALAVVSQATDTFTGKVVGVTDGDTISVLRDGKAVKIRLDGIDCPEAGDDFGSKAKKFTSSLVFGKVVEVRGKQNDRYGRLVARVLVDGQDLSVALVQAGLAWHYLKYSSDPVLRRAESTAKAGEIGVWSLPNPLPPWEVRSQRRHGKGIVGSGRGDEGDGAANDTAGISDTAAFTPSITRPKLRSRGQDGIARAGQGQEGDLQAQSDDRSR